MVTRVSDHNYNIATIQLMYQPHTQDFTFQDTYGSLFACSAIYNIKTTGCCCCLCHDPGIVYSLDSGDAQELCTKCAMYACGDVITQQILKCRCCGNQATHFQRLENEFSLPHDHKDHNQF